MSMDLLRSSHFRITILCMLFFTLSSMAMLVAIHFEASREFRKTLQDQIATESEYLRRESDTKSYDELVLNIRARSNAPATGFFLYAIADPSGVQRIGNLPVDRLRTGWSEVLLKSNTIDPDDQGEMLLLMYGSALDNGNLLIVGAGLDQVHDLRRLIIDSFVSSLAFILPIVLGGGIFLSRAVLARVSSIHRVSKEIMAGDLSRRLPIKGSNDEFDQLSNSINAMLGRIEELMASMKQVTTDIAHDLRTPLGRLLQHLDNLNLANPRLEITLAVIDKAKSETNQIIRTFDALLQIGHISVLDMRKRFTDVDLSELAGQLAESYQAVAAEKHQQLSTLIKPALCVAGNRELLAQMLVNLIENAVNHSPHGAHIKIRVGDDNDRVELTVSDSGPGIPPEHRRNVFQPFFRLERSRTTPGSGLGLALVSSIAKVHGIGISLTDNSPGLVFRLAFPQNPDSLIAAGDQKPIPQHGDGSLHGLKERWGLG
jgi:signal transduction histidine kinase